MTAFAKSIALLKLLRIRHWIKNGLVLFPLFFSGKICNWDSAVSGIFGFLIFSLLSSSIYLFNDIQDVEKDRNHPEKRNRPLAAGVFSIRTAWGMSIGLTVLALTAELAFFANYTALLILLIYWGLNLAYSKGFKDIPVIDFSILASGFVLRILYGGILCDIPISHWLFLCILSAALFMGIGKRRNELRSIGKDGATREVLKLYSKDFLDKNMYLSAALALVFYSLWSVSPSLADSRMVYTVPLVLLVFFRYSFLTESESSSGDPVNVFFGDRILQLLSFVFALTLLFLFLTGKEFIK